MTERPKYTPPDHSEHRPLVDLPPAQVQHGEVLGLEELLQKKDQLPNLDVTKFDYNFEESAPLLPMLERKVHVVPQPNVAGCVMKLEKVNVQKKFFSYRLRIPLSLIPLPRYAPVEAEWVDLGLLPLQELAQLGAEYAGQLTSIVAAVKHFEETHHLVVKGDGVVFVPA